MSEVFVKEVYQLQHVCGHVLLILRVDFCSIRVDGVGRNMHRPPHLEDRDQKACRAPPPPCAPGGGKHGIAQGLRICCSNVTSCQYAGVGAYHG